MTLALAVACGSADHGSGASGPAATAQGSDGSVSDAGDAVPWRVTPFPSVVAPPENPTTDAKVELGRLLFYDPIVSIDHQTACATCHSEIWGMSDALPRSVGQGAGPVAGPGRSGPNRTRRNSMTLWNVAYRQSAFWDGRANSLEDQVHFPFDSPQEFAQSLDAVVDQIRAIPRYVDLFATAFPGSDVSAVTFASAIAAFERTLVSNHGLYESYLDGDSEALSESMVRGMALFSAEGCTDCHLPPLFSSERFEDRGIPAVDGIADAGRFEVTGDEADRNKFKVPTLRNAHETGPYFHTGAVTLPGDAVKHEVEYSVAHDGARALDDIETADLTAFIVSGLFDSKNSPTRPHEVPSGLQVPIDGSSIRR